MVLTLPEARPGQPYIDIAGKHNSGAVDCCELRCQIEETWPSELVQGCEVAELCDGVVDDACDVVDVVDHPANEQYTWLSCMTASMHALAGIKSQADAFQRSVWLAVMSAALSIGLDLLHPQILC